MIEIISILFLSIWITCTEIRLLRLNEQNKFLKERLVDVDARTCILEMNIERK